MAKIIYSPDGDGDYHKCYKELPGQVISDVGEFKYYPKAKDGTVVQCSCGNVYRAKHTGYSSLGCEYVKISWWETRKYKKKAGNW